MSALVLDAGALVAVERDDRATVALLKEAHSRSRQFKTAGTVVAQVWRRPDGRQAALAQFLKSVDVRAVDEEIGKQAGILLGKAKTNDVVDATVVAIARDGDRIVTSDVQDIQRLVTASGRLINIERC